METAIATRCNHGANIRRWREWRGFTQPQLAEKIGIPQSRLSSYEQEAQLDEELLVKIAKELDIPVEAITEMEDGATVNIFSGTFSASDSAAVAAGQLYQPTFNAVDKFVELYDKLLKEKEEKIVALEAQLKDKK